MLWFQCLDLRSMCETDMPRFNPHSGNHHMLCDVTSGTICGTFFSAENKVNVIVIKIEMNGIRFFTGGLYRGQRYMPSGTNRICYFITGYLQ